jgi:uncharacterized protein (DUF302 family)
MKLGFKRVLDIPVDAAVERVEEVLKGEGFGVLVDLDVQGIMKKKLDLNRRPYRILGACNPSLANRALNALPDIGLMLPCNIVVYQDDGDRTVVNAMNPEIALGLVDNDELAEVAREVSARLQAVIEAL